MYHIDLDLTPPEVKVLKGKALEEGRTVRSLVTEIVKNNLIHVVKTKNKKEANTVA